MVFFHLGTDGHASKRAKWLASLSKTTLKALPKRSSLEKAKVGTLLSLIQLSRPTIGLLLERVQLTREAAGILGLGYDEICHLDLYQVLFQVFVLAFDGRRRQSQQLQQEQEQEQEHGKSEAIISEPGSFLEVLQVRDKFERQGMAMGDEGVSFGSSPASHAAPVSRSGSSSSSSSSTSTSSSSAPSSLHRVATDIAKGLCFFCGADEHQISTLLVCFAPVFDVLAYVYSIFFFFCSASSFVFVFMRIYLQNRKQVKVVLRSERLGQWEVADWRLFLQFVKVPKVAPLLLLPLFVFVCFRIAFIKYSFTVIN